MSKFLSNSVNYSESNFIKTHMLRPILEKYNSVILDSYKNTFLDSIDTVMFIPNNGVKYFLLIVDKKDATTVKGDYKILYFFPEKYTSIHSDFFMEIDFVECFPKKSYLLEGYLYNECNFLVTDLLAIEEIVFETDYHMRLDTIHEIIPVDGITNINCFMNVTIHPVFSFSESNFKSLLNVFKNNFMFKKEINSIEYVKLNSFKKTTETDTVDLIQNETKKMIITKTKYSDVYKINDFETGKDEGILYVKTISISKELSKLSDQIVVSCTYNSKFYKWQPVF